MHAHGTSANLVHVLEIEVNLRASLGKEVAVHVATQTPEQRLSGIGVAHTSCLHGHRGSTLHSRPLWTRGIQGERRAGSTSINKLGLARGDRDWDYTSPVKLTYLNHYL